MLYIIVKGEVVFSTQDGDGQRTEIGRCVNEAYFGERALLNKSVRAATATTVKPTRLVKLDVEAFVSLLGPLEDTFKNKVVMP